MGRRGGPAARQARRRALRGGTWLGLIGGLVAWAQATFGEYGVWGLVLLAATEAVVSPIPPDILLPVLAVDEPWQVALWLGIVTTLASVAGAAIGYWIGLRFSPWVHRRFGGPRLARVEAWYRHYGEWIVVLAAFTPLPFKLFTVSSGLLRLRFAWFLLASLVGRGLRFIPEALLSARYGAQAIEWLDRGGLVVMLATLAGLAVVYAAHRYRRHRRAAGAERE